MLEGGKWTIAAFHGALLTLGLAMSLLAALFLSAAAVRAGPPPGEAETVPAMAQTGPPPASVRPANLLLPYAVYETDVVAVRIGEYEGPYIEDGSYREVAKVSALLVRNNGSQVVESGEVILERGGLLLRFPFTMLPPGELVMVLEGDEKYCPEINFTACYGWADRLTAAPLPKDALELTQEGMGGLRVTNRAGEALGPVTLYYKTHDAQGNLYIGGRTYTVQVYPEHYAAGYSQVFLFLENDQTE